jgi:succinoglycan biosynthesis protein ExoL
MRGERPAHEAPHSRVVVLMSNWDDAHQRRFVAGLRRLGYPTEVAAYARDDYYRVEDPAEGDPRVLGVIANEAYLSRVPIYLRSLPQLRAALRDADVVVAFSSEHVLLARAATALRRRRPPIVREFADVPRAVDDRGRWVPLARVIERLGVRRSAAVVVTAEGFGDPYLRSEVGYDGPIAVLPNKPDVPRPPRLAWAPPVPGEALRILYAGLLRCRTSLGILQAAADAAAGGIEVTVRGHNLTGFAIEESEHFRFAGAYRSPDDLARMYGACHVVYSGYPYEPERSNYRLARTNRFYETVFFGRPQIAHEGTADGRAVQAADLGIVVDPADPETAARRIARTPVETWARCAANARRRAAGWSSFEEDFAGMVGVVAEALGCR